MKEILKTLVETMTLPEDSYLEQDAEILEIFIEELDEIFVELEPLIVQWIEQPNQQDVLTDIRRHFHTLKVLEGWLVPNLQVNWRGRLKIL
jgi:chemosensory pili system protein ChpA (sensor histidine kinase/response regulator)